jgi:hypothetical protein
MLFSCATSGDSYPGRYKAQSEYLRYLYSHIFYFINKKQSQTSSKTYSSCYLCISIYRRALINNLKTIKKSVINKFIWTLSYEPKLYDVTIICAFTTVFQRVWQWHFFQYYKRIQLLSAVRTIYFNPLPSCTFIVSDFFFVILYFSVLLFFSLYLGLVR